MSDYGLRISQDNTQVKTAVKKEQRFASPYTSFKIHKTSLNKGPIDVTIPATSTGTDVVISHALGYAPSFLVWAEDEDGLWHFRNSSGFSLDGSASTDIILAFVYSDDTQVVLSFTNIPGGDTTIGYHYMILMDPGI